MIPSPPDTRASLILRLPDAADAAAWDELVAIYGPLVFRMAVRQGLQAADADDLVQNVFAAIARSVAEWLERPDRGKFRAWLLRIARNAAVNFLTRRGHRSLGTGDTAVAQLLAETELIEVCLEPALLNSVVWGRQNVLWPRQSHAYQRNDYGRPHAAPENPGLLSSRVRHRTGKRHLL